MLTRACANNFVMVFPALAEEAGVVHAFTMKPWNMAPHRGAGADRAVEHRRRVCELLDVDFDQLTSPSQVHGAEILCVEDADIGRGRLGRPTAVPFVDGLMTDRPGVPLILLSADCPLVLAYDAARRAMGIVHASWLGTAAGITARLVQQMVQCFGCDPANMRAAIAPSAGPDRYEVGLDVVRVFRSRWPDADRYVRPHGEKFMLDLWAANTAQLVAGGVRADRIEVAGLCTIGDDRFWSHRRDGADAGRSALVAAIRS